MRKIAIYTLTSELHDEKAVNAVTNEFLSSLNVDYDFQGSDYASYGTHALDLIYVRTGGTEGIFLRLIHLKENQSPVKSIRSKNETGALSVRHHW